VAAQLSVMAFAARGGWLPQLMRGYGEVARSVVPLLAERRKVQAARSRDATDVEHLSASIQFEGFDHPLLTKVANPLLEAYWKLVRPLVAR
jgi:hypothetical protein